MTKSELDEILARHKIWLTDSTTGARANLTRADLTGANLTGADLTGANLTYADLTRADLTGANLTRANLTYADLTGADLTGADLTGANLTRAYLTGANIDYSSWPLHCGSLNVKIDKRIACQLLYHTICAMQSVEDKECKRFCGMEEVIALSNQFHRVNECGVIK